MDREEGLVDMIERAKDRHTRLGENPSTRAERRGVGSDRASGRYAIYEAIASGGMANVHLARLLGPAGFSRIVAVKRLHHAYAASDEFVSMFLDEARLVARIKHPNVVPTLDVVSAAGELSIVMEYVQGESLARLLKTARARNAPVPLGVVCAIMSGVLHGLHAAHEATSERGDPLGIVHRDVSPQNVLVGADGAPRVLDFGIAKAAGRMQETRDGVLKGKIAYMAPEQVQGASATRTTDVYAAGVLLWEMLSGERFNDAENDVARIVNALSGRRDPPSRHAWGKTRHSSSSLASGTTLDAITMRALSMAPEQRYSTAREMAAALEQAAPLATPSEVAAWVTSLAQDTLAERAELVRAIECGEQDETRLSVVLRTDGAVVPARSPELTADGQPTLVEPLKARSLEPDSNLTPRPVTYTQLEAEIATFRPKRRVPLALGVSGVVVVLAFIAVSARSGGAAPAASTRFASAPPPVVSLVAPAEPQESAKPDAGAAPVASTTVALKPPTTPTRRKPKTDLEIRLAR